MEKILLFQLSERDREMIEKIASNMRIKVAAVEKEQYRQTVGALAEGNYSEAAEVYNGTPPEGSLIIFCHLTEKHMDRILFELRNKKADITYKAALTPSNARWNVLRMYAMMEQEKRTYNK